jgi:hypothetical protein
MPVSALPMAARLLGILRRNIRSFLMRKPGLDDKWRRGLRGNAT